MKIFRAYKIREDGRKLEHASKYLDLTELLIEQERKLHPDSIFTEILEEEVPDDYLDTWLKRKS